VSTEDARGAAAPLSGAQRLAELLLHEVERIAERSAVHMQELLPSYTRVPRGELTPIVQANTRNILEAIRDPDADRRRAGDDHQASGNTRARQGITSDEMLHAWRIGLESIREEAHAVADAHGIGKDVLLEFIEATLRWGDIGMRASASAHHEAEIRELGRLVEEQAALRRVATMVARESSAEAVLAKVAEEVALLLEAEVAAIHRFDADGYATIVGAYGLGDAFGVGSRRELDRDSTAGLVYRTEQPVRVDGYEHLPDAIAAESRELGVHSAVGSPIVVSGRLWGAIVAGTSRAEPMPDGAESRIAEFTELVATAISNVQARSDLAASRGRIVAAADEERRRVVRDLHDGAQARLVHTIVTLKMARRELERYGPDAATLVDEPLKHAETANDEMRELAHGILPPVLTRCGLDEALRSLASRTSVPVEIDIPVDRFPGAVEATAYFVVAEALTNVAKHAHAQRATVNARLEDGTLKLEVRDDGIGGARTEGTGLLGLGDRLAALEGRFRVESPPGGGTLIAASIPVR
jgi:signal transduction histidine kinase